LGAAGYFYVSKKIPLRKIERTANNKSRDF